MAISSVALPSLRLPSRLSTPAVLVGVWLLFGAAFVAVRTGVHGPGAVPPFLFSGTRFLVAGTILLAWSAWRAGWRLNLRLADVAAAAVVGVRLRGRRRGAAGWGSPSVPARRLAVRMASASVRVG